MNDKLKKAWKEKNQEELINIYIDTPNLFKELILPPRKNEEILINIGLNDLFNKMIEKENYSQKELNEFLLYSVNNKNYIALQYILPYLNEILEINNTNILDYMLENKYRWDEDLIDILLSKELSEELAYKMMNKANNMEYPSGHDYNKIKWHNFYSQFQAKNLNKKLPINDLKNKPVKI